MYTFRIISLLLSAFVSIITSSAEDKIIKLGAVLPLTGDLAYYGEEIRNGIILAQKSLPFPVEFYVEDAPLSGARIIAGLNKLISLHKIDAIAGNFSNVAMLSMAPKIEQYQIPTFHTAAIDDQILGATSWVFSTNVRVRDEGYHVAEYLYNNFHARTAAVIYAQSNFGVGYRDSFIRRFTELGGKIVFDIDHSINSLDLRVQTLKVKSSNPDAVFLGTFGPFLGTAVRQLRDLQISVPLFTVYEAEDPSVEAVAGGASLEGIKYFVSYVDNNEFVEEYKRIYNRVPTTFALNSYDATKILATAIHECEFNKECIKKKLLWTRDYNGVSGVINIESDGAAKREFYMHGYLNGRFQRISG